MKWLTLFNKIGKQPMRITRVEDVCVVDWNGKRKRLDIKYDAHGLPYFVFVDRTESKEE